MLPARLQSGAIRSFIRGSVQPLLPPVSESTGLTPTTSAELPAGIPAGPPHANQPLHRTSDAAPVSPSSLAILAGRDDFIDTKEGLPSTFTHSFLKLVAINLACLPVHSTFNFSTDLLLLSIQQVVQTSRSSDERPL